MGARLGKTGTRHPTWKRWWRVFSGEGGRRVNTATCQQATRVGASPSSRPIGHVVRPQSNIAFAMGEAVVTAGSNNKRSVTVGGVRRCVNLTSPCPVTRGISRTSLAASLISSFHLSLLLTALWDPANSHSVQSCVLSFVNGVLDIFSVSLRSYDALEVSSSEKFVNSVIPLKCMIFSPRLFKLV